MSENEGHTVEIDDGLTPESRGGVDSISFVEGAMAALFSLGISQGLGDPIEPGVLIVIGGIGTAVAVLWEVYR